MFIGFLTILYVSGSQEQLIETLMVLPQERKLTFDVIQLEKFGKRGPGGNLCPASQLQMKLILDPLFRLELKMKK